MKVKFGNLNGLDGKELKGANNEPIKIYQNLANVIANERTRENIEQRYKLALKIFKSNGEEFDLTESEKEIIEQSVRSGSTTVLLSAQILNIINNAKD
jgi:hypothetical protein